MSLPSKAITQTIVVGNKPLKSYLLDIIVSFNRGIDVVEIIGKGKNITRAVTLYNMLSSRLSDSIHLEGVEIGSVFERGRRISYIKIRIKRV